MKNELIAISAVVVALDGRIGVTPSKMANDIAAVTNADKTTSTPGAAIARRPAISSKRVPTLEASKSPVKSGASIFEITAGLALICAIYATLCGRITTKSAVLSSHHISKMKFSRRWVPAAFYKPQSRDRGFFFAQCCG